MHALFCCEWNNTQIEKNNNRNSVKNLFFSQFYENAFFYHFSHRFIPLTFILPAVTSALVQFVFGSQLHDMKFGYVNNDYPFTNLSSIADFNDSRANCYESKFSHLFLSRIPSDSLTLVMTLTYHHLLTTDQN